MILFQKLCTALLAFSCLGLNAQSLQVSTVLENINASGGVTTDRQGNVYISDYGATLRNPPTPTKVYKLEIRTGKVSVFADGFLGASGACFDAKGNFYQSNPFGNKVSKRSADGTLQLDWAYDSLSLPVGLATDAKNRIYVCNCSGNYISRIQPSGQTERFAQSTEFKCPNGLTIDPAGNLYACNFGNGKILKITPDGAVSVFAELPVLTGGPSPVGNGHLTWANGFLFVTTIGQGAVYKISMAGEPEHIAGAPFSLKNTDGPALEAGFSKPNGIAASPSGDTLYLNVSDPSWVQNPPGLHPAHLKMITGLCSLPDIACKKPLKGLFARLRDWFRRKPE